MWPGTDAIPPLWRRWSTELMRCSPESTNCHDCQTLERRFFQRSRSIHFRSRERCRLPGRDGRSVQGHALHHPRIRTAAQNPRVSKPVGHVVLSFSPRDAARLDNRLLLSIAVEYLDRMGIKDTQLIIVRHRDREHPHLHILFNRVGNDGRTISDRNDRYRSERLCKQLTARYGLYFASGKEQVKEYRLREPDKTKYEIYHALCDTVPRCRNWEELTAALRREGIATEFRMRGGTSDVQGVVFAKNGYPFTGSSAIRKSTPRLNGTADRRLLPNDNRLRPRHPRSATCWTICCVRGLIPTRRNKPSRNNSADAAGDDIKRYVINHQYQKTIKSKRDLVQFI